MEDKWELLCENNLYKSVTSQVEPYLTEKMTEVQRIIAKTKIIPSIKKQINIFSNQNNVDTLTIIDKLRTMMAEKDGEQFSIIGEVLDGIENSIKLQEKEEEK